MTSWTIRVGSTALGERQYVTVHIYDTLDQMQRAGQRYNGSDTVGVAGLCQALIDNHGRAVDVRVRLARGHLGTRIVSHEMHHAATALYGAAVGDRISRTAHLNHHNEPFAHLYSDLLHRLVDQLYKLGYYDEATA